MATASQGDRSELNAPGHWLADLRALLDRPLTSYHLVVGVTGLLLGLGLVMVLSASSVYALLNHGNSYAVFARQAMWVVIGLPLAWVAARTSTRTFRVCAYPALVVSVALLALTYVPGIGVEVNGNRNWISFGGPFHLQPSELAKLAVVVWCADLYARKERLLWQWKHLLVPVVPVTAAVVALVVGQGDLGTALVLIAIVLGMLWVVGAPLRLFGATALAVGGLAVYLATTTAERRDRLTMFLDPFADYNDSGWQAAHGFYALASGSWLGVGIGASRQKWGSLPAAHTDFIFAVIGEELGLFGTLAVLALFLSLAYAGVRIALRAGEPFARYAAAGITVWLLSQALVNLASVLGLLPVIGIPLPLVSYGGSALLPTLVALGMLASFARSEPAARRVLPARERWWRRGGQRKG